MTHKYIRNISIAKHDTLTPSGRVVRGRPKRGTVNSPPSILDGSTRQLTSILHSRLSPALPTINMKILIFTRLWSQLLADWRQHRPTGPRRRPVCYLQRRRKQSAAETTFRCDHAASRFVIFLQTFRCYENVTVKLYSPDNSTMRIYLGQKQCMK